MTESEIQDQKRAEKIKQLTGGVLLTESKIEPNYVKKKGTNLLQQADSIKKKENMQRLKDLDELNKVSSEQEQLIYQQKLEIKALNEDLSQAFKDLAEKDSIIKRLESRATNLTTDQDKSLQKMKKLEDKNEKFKQTNMELRKKLQDMERMSKGSNKQYTHLEKTVKNLNSQIEKKELKIRKMKEENEKLKILNSNQNDFQSRKKEKVKMQDKLIAENKKLEKQRNELLTGFKKQIKLIDLLKRQIVHLEAAQMLKFTENEFMQALDIGDKL